MLGLIPKDRVRNEDTLRRTEVDNIIQGNENGLDTLLEWRAGVGPKKQTSNSMDG